MWEPTSEDELLELIDIAEAEMSPRDLLFWELVRIRPTKWASPPWGDSGGGFWVVAIWGMQCMWLNDIEDGFNVSHFDTFGVIGKYWCNQDELHECVADCNFYHQLRNAE